MYFVPIYYCEDGQRRRSEPIYDGTDRIFTDMSREKVGIGTTGALILRGDKKGCETVTGFLPEFDADTGQVTSARLVLLVIRVNTCSKVRIKQYTID